VLAATAVLGVGGVWAEPAADDPQELRSKLQALHWIKGPTTVTVGDNAHLRVPDDYVFLDVANTAKFEEILHNLGAGKEVMVAPKSLQWTAYLDFTAAGYVKDDEKIDAPALLKTLKQNTDDANRERARRGWDPVHIVDWATPPAYNPETRRLEWATLLESGNDRGVNFFTKILGRRGFTSVVLATDPADLSTARGELETLVDGYSYDSGESYADWRQGDKVAEYGLAALIVGGAAAVAAKKGLFSALFAFLVAGWKIVAAAMAGAIAWLRTRLRRRA
jgi:uncharacterized membrane-anchored protein